MSGWFVGVDIGGTFTDIVAIEESSGALRHLKVPSSKADPAGAVMRGLEALDERCGVPPDGVRLIMHGTTLATNAIIERRLARTALVTTRGFRDVLEIGRHWRQELYDPFVEALPPLVPRELRFEVTERTTAAGEELVPLDAGDVAQVLAELERADVTAVAVVLLHSYRDPAHEDALVARLRATNGWSVCGSAELSGELREYERSSTTVINAALMPLVDQYLERLEHGLADSRATPSLFITQSNGGALTPQAARARPVALAMSGPVGGVVACVELGRTIGQSNLIGLDMGGTSTDISIVSDGEPRRTSELDVGGLPVRLPSIQVLSIGAGGGSIASVDAGGSLRVGPESAGSDPGPACYDRGGTLPTVTDCQLVLGRLSEDRPLAGTLRLARRPGPRGRRAAHRGPARHDGRGGRGGSGGDRELGHGSRRARRAARPRRRPAGVCARRVRRRRPAACRRARPAARHPPGRRAPASGNAVGARVPGRRRAPGLRRECPAPQRRARADPGGGCDLRRPRAARAGRRRSAMVSSIRARSSSSAPATCATPARRTRSPFPSPAEHSQPGTSRPSPRASTNCTTAHMHSRARASNASS